jgi:hypothetical protein
MIGPLSTTRAQFLGLMLGGDLCVGMYRKAMSVGKTGKSMTVGELALWQRIVSEKSPLGVRNSRSPLAHILRV